MKVSLPPPGNRNHDQWHCDRQPHDGPEVVGVRSNEDSCDREQHYDADKDQSACKMLTWLGNEAANSSTLEKLGRNDYGNERDDCNDEC